MKNDYTPLSPDGTSRPESPHPPGFQLSAYLPQIENLNILSPKVTEINLWNLALREHYKRNSHHPEHFSDPSEMDDLSKKHMLCDLLASQLGGQWKFKLRQEWTIPRAANVCKNWTNWKYVEHIYTGSYDETLMIIFPRWPKNGRFNYEKLIFIAFLKSILHGKITMDQFITGLYGLACVRYYLEDLQYHKSAIVYVGQILFPEDKELKETLATHDDDKLDALMIASYVLKWIFEEEVVEMNETFDGIQFDSFNYFMIEMGKQSIKKFTKDENL